MRRKMLVFLATGICATSLLLLRGQAPAQQPSKGLPEDGTKIGDGILALDVVLGSGIAGRETIWMTDAHVVKIGDRHYLRGKAYVGNEREDDPKVNWMKGVPTYTAVDTVCGFYDMSPKDFEAYAASNKKD